MLWSFRLLLCSSDCWRFVISTTLFSSFIPFMKLNMCEIYFVPHIYRKKNTLYQSTIQNIIQEMSNLRHACKTSFSVSPINNKHDSVRTVQVLNTLRLLKLQKLRAAADRLIIQDSNLSYRKYYINSCRLINESLLPKKYINRLEIHEITAVNQLSTNFKLLSHLKIGHYKSQFTVYQHTFTHLTSYYILTVKVPLYIK